MLPRVLNLVFPCFLLGVAGNLIKGHDPAVRDLGVVPEVALIHGVWVGSREGVSWEAYPRAKDRGRLGRECEGRCERCTRSSC
ncbi:hypothetical protein B0J18DRAFT_438220 [Chaetomium sp. MPI-SDFR-AT-0129]|nr:hypothetical protein B0J18DRAFT_438220 [Chaetomium sp. MPI-SDFR-AT-0129]